MLSREASESDDDDDDDDDENASNEFRAPRSQPVSAPKTLKGSRRRIVRFNFYPLAGSIHQKHARCLSHLSHQIAKPFFFFSTTSKAFKKKKNTNLVERPDALLPGVRLEVLEDHLGDDEARRGQVWGQLLRGSSSSSSRTGRSFVHGAFFFFALARRKKKNEACRVLTLLLLLSLFTFFSINQERSRGRYTQPHLWASVHATGSLKQVSSPRLAYNIPR